MKTITQEELDIIIKQHKLWYNTNCETGCPINLEGYDLSYLDFSNCDLRNTEFYSCNLENANFSGSDLTRVLFKNCENLETIITNENTLPEIRCPENGEFVGYKKCQVYNEDDVCFVCIVELLIPNDAKRISLITNECRCDKAKVLGFYDFDGEKIKLNENEIVVSLYDNSFEYKIGEFVYTDSFDKCRWNERSNGIHFFMKFDEAVKNTGIKSNSMKKISKNNLDKKIEAHKLYLNKNFEDGMRLYLNGYDLSNLDFSNHDLKNAYFYGCNLKNTNFSGSDLTDVWFELCDNLETIITNENTLPKICCPEKGEFIGYKKCRLYDLNNVFTNIFHSRYSDCVAKLLIPNDAKRTSGTWNNCRCDKAKILGFYDLNGKKIKLDEEEIVTPLIYIDLLEYKLGKYAYSDSFDDCRWNSRTHGIHFFMTFEEAVDFS